MLEDFCLIFFSVGDISLFLSFSCGDSGAMESDYPSTENITATAESADDTTSVSSNDSSFGNVTLVSASIPATPGSSTPTSDRGETRTNNLCGYRGKILGCGGCGWSSEGKERGGGSYYWYVLTISPQEFLTMLQCES